MHPESLDEVPDIDHMAETLKILVPVILLMVIVIGGLILNFLVILATALSKRLQVPSNLFICSLSLSDFVLCSVPCALSIYALLISQESTLSPTLCGVSVTVTHICALQTLVSFPMIAYNRYVLVVRTGGIYRRRYSMQNSVILIVASWFLAVTVVLVITFLQQVKFKYNPRQRLCLNLGAKPAISILDLSTLVLCSTIAARSYIQIYVHLTRRMEKRNIMTSNQIRSQRAKITVTKNMFLVTAVFAVCCLPITVLRVVDMKAEQVTPIWHRMFTTLFFASALLNPLLYAGRHQIYKDCIWAILHCREPDKIYMDSLRRIAKRKRSKPPRDTGISNTSSVATRSTYVLDESSTSGIRIQELTEGQGAPHSRI